MTTCGGRPSSFCKSRPTRMLKSWSVPPISTSACTMTESQPWSSGYCNSCRLTGAPPWKRVLEILALQHLLERHAAVEPDDLLVVHHLEPFAVEHDLRPGGVEHLERLPPVGFGVGHDGFVRQLRPGDRAAAGVADHRGEIADDEDALMAEVLELPQLLENDRVAEMDVGRGRVNAEFDAQRPAGAAVFRAVRPR